MTFFVKFYLIEWRCDMVDLDIDKEQQEIPNFIFPRLIEWMRTHGQSDKDIIDCIMYICGEDEK